ncbi:NAD(P)-binding protein [Tenacibaculum retecalamus]|uniref:NAD(P)-binding protein n=1 Tax=Tenacibaculum retecalamus TaxID=3018315 RepID=UPI0023D908C6|nr:NAD(P)-binding protein [Tenacibaculum retecalamus]WBX71269.1 NAD(P)-binding protein [Tenacibaculum retecalamus]
MDKIYNVGIIGGGISGVVVALELAKHNVDTILFEQEKSLVNGLLFVIYMLAVIYIPTFLMNNVKYL